MRRIVLVALLLSLLTAAPAAADSIAYIQNGDVWLATPDGARRVQVTRTGIYSAVSQADDGTMIALAAGERLHRLARDGRITADFLTPISDGAAQAGPVNRFHGPFNPQISPDGTRVAYEWFNDSYENDTGCSETSVPPCHVYSQRQGVGISPADRYTGPEAFGLMTGWIYPSWVSNDVLLRSFSGAVMTDDAVFTRVGPGLADSQLDPWFYDADQGFGVDAVELSRDLQTVIGIAGQSDEKLRVYRTTMHPFGAPDWNHRPFAQGNQPVAQRCYELSGRFESTSLAPGGRAMAYGTAEGVWVAAIPEGCAPGAAGALVFKGASSPDWGPADVPPTLALSRRGGLTATLTTGAAGRATLTASLKGRTLARRTVKVGATGRATVRFKLKRRGTVTVKATFAPAAGGGRQSVRATLRLR